MQADAARVTARRAKLMAERACVQRPGTPEDSSAPDQSGVQRAHRCGGTETANRKIEINAIASHRNITTPVRYPSHQF
jgi:hypothetical protein